MAAGLEGVQAVNRGTGYVTACRGLPRARRAARRVPRRLEVPRLCHAGPIPPSRPPGAVSADPRFRPRAAADVRSGRAVSRATAHPGGDARQMSRNSYTTFLTCANEPVRRSSCTVVAQAEQCRSHAALV